MKIGINSRIYQYSNSGVQIYLKSLFNELKNIDKKNEYVFFQTNENKKLGTTKTINLPESLLSTALFDNLLITKLIKQEKIDIFWGPSFILPYFKVNKVRYVVMIHDVAFMAISHLYEKLHVMYYKFAVQRSLRNADVIVTNSISTKNELIKYFKLPANKIKVIYLGIDKVFLTPKKRKRIIKEKYIFSLTTQPTRKNITSILKVIAGDKFFKNYKYVIAGLIDNTQEKELIAEINKLKLNKQVLLLGYVSDDELISLYQNAEMFVYPSFYEGFGFPVLEAMACSCPVIASNTSSLVELVPQEEWRINPYDISDISAKMIALLRLSEKKKKVLLDKNYTFAQQFTWEKTAQGYLRLFNTLYDTHA